MGTKEYFCWAIALELAAGTASAQSHHAQHHAHGGSGSGSWSGTGLGVGMGAIAGIGLGAIASGSYGGAFPFYSSISPDGVPFSFGPPIIVLLPGGVPPSMDLTGAIPPALRSGQGVAGPVPPPFLARRPFIAGAEPSRPRRPDPNRASQLVTYGDRHFRAGDLHRAAGRYTQALAADPNSALTRVRLAQIALVRGDYAEAAERFREASVAEPGWLVNAPDIQAIYGEPADFSKQIARLETHLQAEPGDRNAWLVLGAQWYLSGQTRKASDIFVRLSDRKADATLAAFLDASAPPKPGQQ